jgi:hypothetical protein
VLLCNVLELELFGKICITDRGNHFMETMMLSMLFDAGAQIILKSNG